MFNKTKRSNMFDIERLSNIILDGIVDSHIGSLTSDNSISDSIYYPDISGAYIASADYDGEPMSTDDVMRLNENYPDLVQYLAEAYLHGIG